MIDISGENVVLVGALLLFVAVMAGKVAYRFGAPALLLFLGVGMLFGLNFISFRSVEMTQFVGMIALCIILFTGGMDTSFQEIKPIIGPGVVLATVGVVMTAMVLAGFVWLVAPWLDLEISFALALLLAATMSSTDSASVFSILRSKKQGLKQHLRPLLELESGSNAPMAYMLTILLIGVVTNSQGGGGLGMSALYFVVQLVVGTLSGYLIGRLAVWTINKINLANHSLYSVLLLAFIGGMFIEKSKGNPVVSAVGLVLGDAACYVLGTAWFVFQMQCELGYALTVCVYPFIALDLGKIVVSCIVGALLRKRLTQAGVLKLQNAVSE